MKDLAALALVILPIGMTIVEILASGEESPAEELPESDKRLSPSLHKIHG